MYRPAPGVPAHRGQNRGGHHRRRFEIRPQPLDGAGLCLHHREEGVHTLERVFPLPHRGGLHPEEPHAVRPHDEACQLSSGPGQRVCAGAGSRHGIHSNRDCEIQKRSIRHICQRQAQIPASRLHPYAEHGLADGGIAGPPQQRHRFAEQGFTTGTWRERGVAQGWLTS